MVQFPNHTASRGSIFHFNHLIEFSQSQSIKCSFLVFRSTNSTFDLLHFYSCHKNLLTL